MSRRRGTSWGRLGVTAITVVLVLILGYLAGLGLSTLTARPSASLSGDVAPSAADSSSTSSAEAPQLPSAGVASAWNADESPNYYRVLGPAEVEQEPAAGTATYGQLDHLGRATGAVSLVTYDSMRAGRDRARGDLSDLTPTGWGHNAEVDIAMPNGTLYHGQLFNRSHLLAKSLGGDDELHNLITATRTQNVGSNLNGTEGGMAYAEGLARSWLEGHRDGTVYYAAQPVYEGDELVARSVIVDVRTSDRSIDERIEVYNTALGFDINYADGTYQVTSDAHELVGQIREVLSGAYGDEVIPEDVTDESVTPTGSPEAENGERKVIVTGSGSAYHHDETCSGLTEARSMEWVTVSEAEAMGRHPCGICGG